MKRYQKEAREYSEAVKNAAPAGVSVYLAKAGHYGFFTNGKRVVSFSVDLAGITLSGNYKAKMACGCGWIITTNPLTPTLESINALLSAMAPEWANPHPVYMTESEYLAIYQSSSEFTKI